MKANAAVGLLACGLSLRLIVGPGRVRLWLAVACAMVAGTIGVLTLSEHIVGWNLGIDELLFIEAPGALATSSPGRMGLNGSVSLTLAAVALLVAAPAARDRPAAGVCDDDHRHSRHRGYWYGARTTRHRAIYRYRVADGFGVAGPECRHPDGPSGRQADCGNSRRRAWRRHGAPAADPGGGGVAGARLCAS